MAVMTRPRPKKPSGRRAIERWNKDPDVMLMLLVQKGDRSAFTQIMDRYWSRIFGRFFRRLGDRQEAEDMTQDVFLRLYRYRDRYKPRASFATWLFHITQNVIRNALRSRRRRSCVCLGALMTETDQLPGSLLRENTGDSPERPMERAETAGVVRHAVAGLAGRQRMALELHQFHDHTYVEVAEQLDMSPKAAKSLLYRARNQLRASLLPLVEGE